MCVQAKPRGIKKTRTTILKWCAVVVVVVVVVFVIVAVLPLLLDLVQISYILQKGLLICSLMYFSAFASIAFSNDPVFWFYTL